jgi:hypothetical protein
MTTQSLQHTSAPARQNRIRGLSAAMVIALLGQLLLGMANTFWLEVPGTGSAWNVAQPAALVTAHMTVGTALLVLACWIGWIAIRTRNRAWLVVSTIGITGIVLGFVGGTAFMGDPSNDVVSFIMAIGCSVALAAYALGLYRLPRAETSN